jgi:hypothetical protein
MKTIKTLILSVAILSCAATAWGMEETVVDAFSLIHEFIDAKQEIVSEHPLNQLSDESKHELCNRTDERGGTLLLHAIVRKNLFWVKWLVDNGTDLEKNLNGDGFFESYLGFAITSYSSVTVTDSPREEHLADSSSSIDEYVEELRKYEITDIFNIISYLVERKALLDVKDCYEDTPLHLAFKHGPLHVLFLEPLVKLLVDAGASLDIRDGDGKTPLECFGYGYYLKRTDKHRIRLYLQTKQALLERMKEDARVVSVKKKARLVSFK